jgi:cation diffusion facilitator CzcD-associated flavoprotein CzcO
MIPRRDRPFGPWEQWAFAHVPGAAKAYRWFLWARAELLLYPVMRQWPLMSRLYRRWATENLENNVLDPALRRILTPDYPIGGKRILIHDDFYPALNRPNVRVVSDAIDRITEAGVRTADGTEHELDAIVLATGFKTNPFLAPMRLVGLGGRSLEDDWSGGAKAYYGITVSGYPSFFMLYGPNTNLGHNSIIFMMECQATYVLKAIEALDRKNLKYLDLRTEVMEAYDAEIQQDLRGTAWSAAGPSWYKDATGRITNNWPHSTFWYWWCTRRFDLTDYRAVVRDPREVELPARVRAAA